MKIFLFIYSIASHSVTSHLQAIFSACLIPAHFATLGIRIHYHSKRDTWNSNLGSWPWSNEAYIMWQIILSALAVSKRGDSLVISDKLENRLKERTHLRSISKLAVFDTSTSPNNIRIENKKDTFSRLLISYNMEIAHLQKS